MAQPSPLKNPALWLGLPTLIWIALFFARPFWYKPWCAEDPSPCVKSAVSAFDQITFRYHSILADFFSNLLQNGVGVCALILPWFFLKRWKWIYPVQLFCLSTTLWNGALLELTRAIVQRPRPLVFQSPLGDGAQISQYTSFYSGHTSFVTLASFCTFLWIHRAFKNLKYSGLTLILGISLTLLTGTLRILGGRHFPTDVICAIVAGTLVSLATYASLHPSLPRKSDLGSAS